MIEQMKTMLESNGKQLQKLSKESTENKAYADELEVAFNELHERSVRFLICVQRRM